MPRPAVAVVGASADRTKFGNKAVRAYRQVGYDVYPVHPKEQVIEGLKVYPTVTDIPVDLDRITIYLPPRVTVKLVGQIAAKGAAEVWLNPGAESDELLAAFRQHDIKPIVACSIMSVGLQPDDFD